ncbi:MAG: ABC transporter ATP-binding protein [Candidatus Liptonbacteria bacterium]|nr:ABC transporter ATP-binding protein [Candidatus Liptonbacteria bacterium]
MIALEIKNLAKHFGGVYAVDNLSLKIEKGSITALVGPNGSGKTTLINVISGLLPMDGGAVVVSGVALKRILPQELPAYGITRTFQNVRLFEQMPVLDNILFVLTERGVFGALFERHSEFHLKQAEEVLRLVGLWEKRNELAVNLSYGQRKLLEIARAYAMRSDIYLFDEPFAGLFPAMVETVAEVFRALKAAGKTIILVEHDMGLIRRLTDYVFVLDSGKLLAEGKPDEVLSRREVVEAYLGE